MFNERRYRALIRIIKSNSPDIVSGNSCHSYKPGKYTDTRALYDAPLGPIPMFNECLSLAIGTGGISHCPNVVRGYRGHSTKFVVYRLDIGALHDAPFRAIPML